MRIALVHELLTMRGGAERMLRALANMYPEAPIYTLLYDEHKLGAWFPRHRIVPSRLQKWANLSTNHHWYLRRFPRAVEEWEFTDYDLVISSSSAFAHGILTKGRTKHLSFIHSPARYLWDRTHDVLERAPSVARPWLKSTFHRLRQWDVVAGERPHALLAASRAVQRRIELYWRRESDVLYPFVDTDAFALHKGKRENYYVLVSSLVPYKRIDRAVQACTALGRELKIIGEGPHRRALEQMAGPTIEFLGYTENIAPILQQARGLLLPGEEDFGIAPLEAMACGTPVLAYRGAGALETIQEGKTGLFFAEDLAGALQHFEQQQYSPYACRAQAERFAQEKFEEGIRTAVSRLTTVPAAHSLEL